MYHIYVHIFCNWHQGFKGHIYKVTETPGGKQALSILSCLRSWVSDFLVAWRTKRRIFFMFSPNKVFITQKAETFNGIHFWEKVNEKFNQIIERHDKKMSPPGNSVWGNKLLVKLQTIRYLTCRVFVQLHASWSKRSQAKRVQFKVPPVWWCF